MRSRVFDDFDDFAESVRDVDSKMLLRNPQRHIWSTCSVDLRRVDVQLAKLGSGNIAQGQLRTDGYLLYLPLSNAIEYSANGVILPESSLAMFEPGCEFCISTKVEHDWCAAFVPTELFVKGSELAQGTGSCRVICPNPEAVDRFRATVLQIIEAAASCSDFESSPAAARAAADIQRLFTWIITPGQLGEPVHVGRSRVPRHEIIQRSMELLDQRADSPVSVRDLAAAAAVSERTLRTAFNEFFGVGPVRYLQLRHLNRVHRALKTADPDEMSVSQVLIAHGEYEFSRFASRYHELFGQFPSETLRRRTTV